MDISGSQVPPRMVDDADVAVGGRGEAQLS